MSIFKIRNLKKGFFPFLFLLTVGSYVSINLTEAKSQSVIVDYCVLEELGSAPNIPSKLLGQSAPRNNISNCFSKPRTSGDGMFKLEYGIFSRDRIGPQFPIIRNGRFTPPIGQIGLKEFQPHDLSLLTRPKNNKRLRQDNKNPEYRAVLSKRVSRNTRKSNRNIVSSSKKEGAKTRSNAYILARKNIAKKISEDQTKISEKTALLSPPQAPNVPKLPAIKKTKTKPPPPVAITPISEPDEPISMVAKPKPEANKKRSRSNLHRIRFAIGSAAIDSPNDTSLRLVKKKLVNNSKLRVQLMAYAGTGGKSESQARRLSLSRALAVRSRLIGVGIKSTRIDVRALGSRVTEGPVDRVDLILKQR